MVIKRNKQKEGEWRTSFAWFPIWNDDEIIWLEKFEHCWRTTSTGDVGHYYRLPTKEELSELEKGV